MSSSSERTPAIFPLSFTPMSSFPPSVLAKAERVLAILLSLIHIFREVAYFGLVDGKLRAQRVRCLLAGGDDSLALRLSLIHI